MLYVFDRDLELKAILSNDNKDACPFYDAQTREVLNGEYTLNFTVPLSHDDSRHIVERGYVTYNEPNRGFQTFIISEIDEVHGNTEEKVVICDHASIELHDYIIEWQKHLDRSARGILTDVLSVSPWSIGYIDDQGFEGERRSVTFRFKNVLESIFELAELFDAEVFFETKMEGNRIAERLVHFYKRRGRDLGKRFEYKKDIEEIHRTIDTTNLKTALYANGRETTDTNGNQVFLTIESVEWFTPWQPVNKPMGQKYIGDEDARQMWGILQPDGTRRHRFGVFNSTGAETPWQLAFETYDQLQTMKDPIINYSMRVVDLRRLLGLSHETVFMGDRCLVVNDDLNYRVSARVIELVNNLNYPEESEVTLGNFVPTLTSRIRNMSRSHIEQFERMDQIREEGERVGRFVEHLEEITNEKADIEYVDTRVEEAISFAETLANIFDPSFERGSAMWSLQDYPGTRDGEMVTTGYDIPVIHTQDAEMGGRIVRITRQNAVLYARRAIPIDTERYYRFGMRVRERSDNIGVFRTGYIALDENFNVISEKWNLGSRSIRSSDGWIVAQNIQQGIGNESENFPPGTKYIRPAMNVNHDLTNSSIAEIDYFNLEDVTDAYLSGRLADQARSEAEEARRRADDARSGADQALTDADLARKEADRARSDANDARNQAGQAITDANDARNRADQAQSDADRIENEILPTKLSRGDHIDTGWLEGIIDVMQNQILSRNSYVTITDQNGILIMDAPTQNQASTAMMLGGGRFALANSKHPNGSWNWRTFGNGNGFTADELNAGRIRTSLIEILGSTHFRWDGNFIKASNPSDPDQQIRIGAISGSPNILPTWQTSFEGDFQSGMGYTVNSSTVTRYSSSNSYHGSMYQRVVTDGSRTNQGYRLAQTPVIPNFEYNLSAHVLGGTSRVKIIYQEYSVNNTFRRWIYPDETWQMVNGQWQRISVSIRTSDDCYYLAMAVVTADAVSDTFYVDAFQVSEGSELQPWQLPSTYGIGLTNDNGQSWRLLFDHDGFRSINPQGDTTFEILPDGNARFSGDIVGANISTDRDITVGNNIYLGPGEQGGQHKTISFHDIVRIEGPVPDGISQYRGGMNIVATAVFFESSIVNFGHAFTNIPTQPFIRRIISSNTSNLNHQTWYYVNFSNDQKAGSIDTPSGSVIRIVHGGTYLINVNLGYANTATDSVYIIDLRIDGVDYRIGTHHTSSVHSGNLAIGGQLIRQLDPGSEITVRIYGIGGGTFNLLGGATRSWVEVYKLG